MHIQQIMEFTSDKYDSCSADYYSAESDIETTSRVTDGSSLQESGTSGEDRTLLQSDNALTSESPYGVKSDSEIHILKPRTSGKWHAGKPSFASDQENIPPKTAVKKRLKKRGERKKFESFSDNVSIGQSSDDEFDIFEPDDDRMFKKKFSSQICKLYAEKAEVIKRALDERPPNIDALRSAAMSAGGLVTDELRRRIWPRLLGIRDLENRRKRNAAEIEAHGYHKQVVLDVTRVLQRFPPGISDRQREKLQEQLTNLIVSVLLDLPNVHYYQGYHDVAITLLLVLRSELAYHVLKRLSCTHLKEFMGKTMEPTQHLLNLVPCLLRRTNPALFDHFERASLGTIFCLPWVITWLGHEIRQYDTLLQIYDYLMASPPLAPFYLSAAFVASQEKQLLDEEADMAMLHHRLSKLPALQSDWSEIMEAATIMFKKMPPKEMMKEVESYVVMKKRQEEEYFADVKRRAESHRLAVQKKKMFSPKKGSKRHMVEFVIFSVGVAVAASLYAFVKNDITLL